MSIGETTFRDLKRPRTLRMPVTSTESNEKVFRVTKESKPLCGNYKLPIRDAEEPVLEEHDWTELTDEAACALVLKGGNLEYLAFLGQVSQH